MRTLAQIPPGLNLVVQGITSGPLWDQVVNSLLCLEGGAHHRLRSLTDGLLSDLIRAEDDGDRLDAAELRMLASTSCVSIRTSGSC